uniref:Uncharacterized protein n=1 Tax=Anopheles farauti TaxID=69004 RepID=A0A182Q5W0_9DIPT
MVLGKADRIIITIAFLAPEVRNFKFLCTESMFQCEVENWNPRKDGYFVLEHLPTKRPRYLDVKNLLLASLEPHFCIEMAHFVDFLVVLESPEVRSAVIPQACDIESFEVLKTSLQWIHFETNVHLQKVIIAYCPLSEVPPTLAA